MMKKLRIYYYILGTEPYYEEVNSAEEAKIKINAIAHFINAKVNEGVFSPTIVAQRVLKSMMKMIMSGMIGMTKMVMILMNILDK